MTQETTTIQKTHGHPNTESYPQGMRSSNGVQNKTHEDNKTALMATHAASSRRKNGCLADLTQLRSQNL